MVLSGTLREFILADVFQLLSQQKITGKLVLSNGRTEGSVIFRNGLIVAAENYEEKFQRKLFNYLVDLRGNPASKMRDLFAGFEADADGLATEVVRRGLLTGPEISSFAESLIEDLACGLFLWTVGTYRFNSFRNVDSLVPAGVSIATENIVMEAMRRVDEWHRMQEFMAEDTVFVRSDKGVLPAPTATDIKAHPEEYVFSRVDGTTTVQSLVRNSCLSEYKVYESLHVLVQSGRIVPLSEKLSRSVKAALERREFERTTAPFSLLSSVLATAAAVIVILLLGWVLFRHAVFPGRHEQSIVSRNELRLAQAENKALVAQTYFRALYGTKPSRLGDLRRESLLTGRDLTPFAELRRKLEQPGRELYTEQRGEAQ